MAPTLKSAKAMKRGARRDVVLWAGRIPGLLNRSTYLPGARHTGNHPNEITLFGIGSVSRLASAGSTRSCSPWRRVPSGKRHPRTFHSPGGTVPWARRRRSHSVIGPSSPLARNRSAGFRQPRRTAAGVRRLSPRPRSTRPPGLKSAGIEPLVAVCASGGAASLPPTVSAGSSPGEKPNLPPGAGARMRFLSAVARLLLTG